MAEPHPPAKPLLTPLEAQAVTMLGEGHTAKSIAVELGVSVNAVNERLREARRKTGLGSSREVARWLKARHSQENRYEQIGMEPAAPATEQGGARHVVPTRRGLPREAIAMSMILVLATATALLLHPSAQSESEPAATRLALTDGGSIRALHDRLRAEPVDKPWAEEAERRLDSLYTPMPSLGFVTARCATSICEVTGLIAPAGKDRAIDSLRASALVSAVEAAGFGRQLATGIREGTGSSGGSDEAWFTTYWSRDAGAGLAPRIIATTPADGTIVPAGPLTLRVTFDQPMRRASFSFTTPGGAAAFPACDGLPVQSEDGRTFAMQCTVQGGRDYVVGFNTPPFRNFVAARSLVPALPAVVRFGTRRQ